MTFHLITLFPESFTSYLNESILARAQESKLIKFKFYNPRDFAKPTEAARVRAKNGVGEEKPYLRVDEKPYGGGPGMVMKVEPLLHAIVAAKRDAAWHLKKLPVVYLSPQGRKIVQKDLRQLV